VVLKGDVTVYEARGQYQLLVTSIELEGVGALQVAFEKLKQKLAAEGLFASERKRPLPALIQRIGLVTSPTGAAIADVLHVVERRHRGLQIVLSACRVQGQGAAEEVACAIAQLNEWANQGHGLDAILVTRGGGSLEDLWAFNEEVVARAIFHSRVSVVSAVGHEIDFTISDFVADVRAATPSAAAELLTEGMMRRCEWAREMHAHLLELTRDRLRTEREHVDWIRERVARIHPRRVLNERAQRLDDLRSSLLFHAKNLLRHERAELFSVAQRLVRAKPTRIISLRRQSLAEMMRRMREDTRHGDATPTPASGGDSTAPAFAPTRPGSRFLDHPGRADRRNHSRRATDPKRPEAAHEICAGRDPQRG
jgi:exodeoxyribonuclease VII large subunit